MIGEDSAILQCKLCTIVTDPISFTIPVRLSDIWVTKALAFCSIHPTRESMVKRGLLYDPKNLQTNQSNSK